MPSSYTAIIGLRSRLKHELPRQLAGSHVKLSVRLPNQTADQIFYVRRSMTVGAVLAFLLERDFSGQGNTDVVYRLFTAQGKALENSDPIAPVADQLLVLGSAGDRPQFLLTANSKTFPIFKLPAIIGRYNQANPTADLTIDLTGLDDNNTVSRQHARLYLQDGVLMLENISKKNYVLVTPRSTDPRQSSAAEQLQPGQSSVIAAGDQVQLGTVVLTLTEP